MRLRVMSLLKVLQEIIERYRKHTCSEYGLSYLFKHNPHPNMPSAPRPTSMSPIFTTCCFSLRAARALRGPSASFLPLRRLSAPGGSRTSSELCNIHREISRIPSIDEFQFQYAGSGSSSEQESGETIKYAQQTIVE